MMRTDETSILAKPYWQEPGADDLPLHPLPARVDVLIVGAGYAGLSAARETAAGGASTLVLEAGGMGVGCFGRNGGQMAYSIKPSVASLTSLYGEKQAARCHP